MANRTPLTVFTGKMVVPDGASMMQETAVGTTATVRSTSMAQLYPPPDTEFTVYEPIHPCGGSAQYNSNETVPVRTVLLAGAVGAGGTVGVDGLN